MFMISRCDGDDVHLTGCNFGAGSFTKGFSNCPGKRIHILNLMKKMI